jgi:peptidoglycan/xylan/chitin deacetylase (PgdA/CDA1 family)
MGVSGLQDFQNITVLFSIHTKRKEAIWMKKALLIINLILVCLAGCNQQTSEQNRANPNSHDLGVEPQTEITKSQEVRIYSGEEQGYSAADQQRKTDLYHKYQVPKLWGEFIPGVKTQLATDQKVIALTLDACGGPNGSGYDAELIYFLRQENIPATLFINSRWIDANYWTFWALNRIPLFEIENHGTHHRPLSINGRAAWGIKGTEDVNQIFDEVLKNHRKIENLTGKTPKYFRSGTAFYDEVGVKVTNEIGETPVNFNVLGDAGATFKKEQVRDALLNAKPGSIVLLHMNHPNGETAEGIKLAIPELKRRGFTFVKLEDYPLK